MVSIYCSCKSFWDAYERCVWHCVLRVTHPPVHSNGVINYVVAVRLFLTVLRDRLKNFSRYNRIYSHNGRHFFNHFPVSFCYLLTDAPESPTAMSELLRRYTPIIVAQPSPHENQAFDLGWPENRRKSPGSWFKSGCWKTRLTMNECLWNA